MECFNEKDLKHFLEQQENKTFSFSFKEEECETLASVMGQSLKPPSWLFLEGDLGVGKTTFVKNLLESFSYPKEQVSSPTFSIMNVYDLEPSSPFQKILHLDVYRLESFEELFYLGVETELQSTSQILVLVEWAFKFSKPQWMSLFQTFFIKNYPSFLALKIAYDASSPLLRKGELSYPFS
jgi:tRNA threonylcarbamoyl adenosine modification protein YjeE